MRAPGWQAEALVAPADQPDGQHHRQCQQQCQQPHAQRQVLTVALGALHCVQRSQHRRVALAAHDGQGEDASVHGQEVQAEEDTAAHITECHSLVTYVATMKGMLSR